MNKRTGKVGATYGKLTIVGEGQPKCGNRYVVVQCTCGSAPFTTALKHLPNLRNQNCGCSVADVIKDNQHGQCDTPAYYSWASMKSRCYDPNEKAYSEYGAVGVTVCDEWMNFKKFFADMGPRPDGCTLNRIQGANVYSKATCEWATLTVQAYDQKQKSSNSSGRTGVYWRKDRRRWVVRISKENETIYGGSYKAFEDAVTARESLEKELYDFTKE